jgi:hypothetical protein
LILSLKISVLTQEVLAKFEFFPIKCRIQRAAEAYQKCVAKVEREQKDETLIPPLNTKVGCFTIHLTIVSFLVSLAFKPVKQSSKSQENLSLKCLSFHAA